MSSDYHARCEKTGRFVRKHPETQDRLYGVWCAMKERCYNPNNKSYSRYGGRGISVCDEWRKDFSLFAEWAESNGYIKGLTIDRIDGNGNYCPENCRWATTAQQNRNYSRNHMITYNGETKCVTDWADQYGINRTTLLLRLKSGKPLEEVFKKEDGRTTRWKKTISPSLTA
jgi:hypothetical protein